MTLVGGSSKNLVKRGNRVKSLQVTEDAGNINSLFVSQWVFAKCYSKYIESRTRKGNAGREAR